MLVRIPVFPDVFLIVTQLGSAARAAPEDHHPKLCYIWRGRVMAIRRVLRPETVVRFHPPLQKLVNLDRVGRQTFAEVWYY